MNFKSLMSLFTFFLFCAYRAGFGVAPATVAAAATAAARKKLK